MAGIVTKVVWIRWGCPETDVVVRWGGGKVPFWGLPLQR